MVRPPSINKVEMRGAGRLPGAESRSGQSLQGGFAPRWRGAAPSPGQSLGWGCGGLPAPQTGVPGRAAGAGVCRALRTPATRTTASAFPEGFCVSPPCCGSRRGARCLQATALLHPTPGPGEACVGLQITGKTLLAEGLGRGWGGETEAGVGTALTQEPVAGRRLGIPSRRVAPLRAPWITAERCSGGGGGGMSASRGRGRPLIALCNVGAGSLVSPWQPC